MSAIYYYGQDGEKVDIAIKTLFGLDEKELRWSNEIGASVFDFVGFVFRDNTMPVRRPPRNEFFSTRVKRTRSARDPSAEPAAAAGCVRCCWACSSSSPSG